MRISSRTLPLMGSTRKPSPIAHTAGAADRSCAASGPSSNSVRPIFAASVREDVLIGRYLDDKPLALLDARATAVTLGPFLAAPVQQVAGVTLASTPAHQQSRSAVHGSLGA